MRVSLVAAISKNHVLGKDNKLLWHLSDDLKNFKKVTLNKPILMGRNTYESIGFPLPKRDNFVLTSNPNACPSGVFCFSSFEEAIKKANELGHTEISIIGGGKVYESTLKYVTDFHMTFVDCEIEGDTFFPKVDFSSMEVVETFSHPKDDKNEFAWTYYHYRKN